MKTLTNSPSWSEAAFSVQADAGQQAAITVTGRDRWALECLIAAGEKGCTPIEIPGPRWSGYVHNLRTLGVQIETVHERHEGSFPGTHARYVLRSRLSRLGSDGEAA